MFYTLFKNLNVLKMHTWNEIPRPEIIGIKHEIPYLIITWKEMVDKRWDELNVREGFLFTIIGDGYWKYYVFKTLDIFVGNDVSLKH